MDKSLKQLLCGEESEQLRNLIKEKKKVIEKDYNERERVKDDFLFTMLSKGYINEDYRYFLEPFSDETYLYVGDRYYLDIVKNDLRPYFKLKIERRERVIKEIRYYQWSSPSILNNDILTYIIQQNLERQINWFLNAVLNYYEYEQKSDFVDQYVESIESKNGKKEIVRNLLNEVYKKIDSDIAVETKKKILLSFFSDSSAKLFCEWFSIKSDKDVVVARILNDFLEVRKTVLEYVLVNSERDDALKNALTKINLEVKKLSDYNDSVQELLIKDSMFQISKENLDCALAKLNEKPPYPYYDYVRSRGKLKDKIKGLEKLNSFIDEILLKDENLCISPEGIVDLLFTMSIPDEVCEKIAKKIGDESVDLTYLSNLVFEDGINFVLSLEAGAIRILTRLNKIKSDFNNVVYVSCSGAVDETVLLAKKQISKKNRYVSNYKIDGFARSNLNHFCEFLLTEEKVDVKLFNAESLVLINYGFDVVEQAVLLIGKKIEIPDEKIHTLVELSFKERLLGDKSDKAFSLIIKKDFDYFIDSYKRIRDEYRDNWTLGMSVLLQNDYKVFEKKQLDNLMNNISLDDFGSVIMKWCNDVGMYSSSKTVEKLFNETILNSWLAKYGEKEVRKFINNYKDFIDYELDDKLNEMIETAVTKKNSSRIAHLVAIARKYDLKQESITDYRSYPCVFKEIVNELQNNNVINWTKINESVMSIFRTSNFDPVNNLFVLGRHFSNAMERGIIGVNVMLSKENILLYYSKHSSFDAFLSGAIFEAYFDNEGNLKTKLIGLKKMQLLDYFKKFANADAHRFINECLE